MGFGNFLDVKSVFKTNNTYMYQQQINKKIKYEENDEIHNSLLSREISKYEVPRNDVIQFHNIAKLF